MQGVNIVVLQITEPPGPPNPSISNGVKSATTSLAAADQDACDEAVTQASGVRQRVVHDIVTQAASFAQIVYVFTLSMLRPTLAKGRSLVHAVATRVEVSLFD